MKILNAKPRWIRLTVNEIYTIPAGKGLMILGGSIRHVTATNSICKVTSYEITGDIITSIPIGWIPAASLTATYPLFNLSGVVDVTQWSPMIFPEKFKLDFTGDAAALVILNILEFDL